MSTAPVSQRTQLVRGQAVKNEAIVRGIEIADMNQKRNNVNIRTLTPKEIRAAEHTLPGHFSAGAKCQVCMRQECSLAYRTDDGDWRLTCPGDYPRLRGQVRAQFIELRGAGEDRVRWETDWSQRPLWNLSVKPPGDWRQGESSTEFSGPLAPDTPLTLFKQHNDTEAGLNVDLRRDEEGYYPAGFSYAISLLDHSFNDLEVQAVTRLLWSYESWRRLSVTPALLPAPGFIGARNLPTAVENESYPFYKWPDYALPFKLAGTVDVSLE